MANLWSGNNPIKTRSADSITIDDSDDETPAPPKKKLRTDSFPNQTPLARAAGLSSSYSRAIPSTSRNNTEGFPNQTPRARAAGLSSSYSRAIPPTSRDNIAWVTPIQRTLPTEASQSASVSPLSRTERDDFERRITELNQICSAFSERCSVTMRTYTDMRNLLSNDDYSNEPIHSKPIVQKLLKMRLISPIDDVPGSSPTYFFNESYMRLLDSEYQTLCEQYNSLCKAYPKERLISQEVNHFTQLDSRKKELSQKYNRIHNKISNEIANRLIENEFSITLVSRKFDNL